jgi:pilus assembly protein CpaE
MSDQIRLLVVEDVPQVAQYVRDLLNTQTAIKLLEVTADGSRVPELVNSLRPDVLLVDVLLAGRVKTRQIVEAHLKSGSRIPIVILTVPQHPVAVDPARGVHGVLAMPFNAYELITTVEAVHRAAAPVSSGGGVSSMIAVFAPKGGVGRTTLAFNLAVAIGQLGHKTVLVDGGMQFGDLRPLLKVPAEAPSILDLPTDRIGEGDLSEVLWRDPSGIDILLAPPRVEMAEMVTIRDLEKSLSLMRRVYDVLVVDLPATISELNLAFLDASDLILEVVTYDSTTIHNTAAMADTFRTIGYPDEKIRYLVNRADSPGGVSPDTLKRAIGRAPDFTVASGGTLVVNANNEGIPFVLADPRAQISRDISAVAAALLGARQPVAGRR